MLVFPYAAFLSDGLSRDLPGGQPPSRLGFANQPILKLGFSWLLTSMQTGRGKMMPSPTAWKKDKEKRSTRADAPCVTCSSSHGTRPNRGRARRRPCGRAELGLSKLISLNPEAWPRQALRKGESSPGPSPRSAGRELLRVALRNAAQRQLRKPATGAQRFYSNHQPNRALDSHIKPLYSESSLSPSKYSFFK